MEACTPMHHHGSRIIPCNKQLWPLRKHAASHGFAMFSAFYFYPPHICETCKFTILHPLLFPHNPSYVYWCYLFCYFFFKCRATGIRKQERLNTGDDMLNQTNSIDNEAGCCSCCCVSASSTSQLAVTFVRALPQIKMRNNTDAYLKIII